MTAQPSPSEQYRPIILTFLPGCEGDELDLRARLLLMRDRALATKPIACEDSWYLLDLVERVASRDAFRSMHIADLERTRATLVMCVAAASNFDSMNPQPASGEQDASG